MTDSLRKILNILRNPWGWSEAEKREAALAAADEVERWKGAFENMRDWAIANGVDVNTYG